MTATLQHSVPRVSTGGAPALHLVVSSSGKKVTALHPPGRESPLRLNASRRLINCGRSGRHFFSRVAVSDVDLQGVDDLQGGNRRFTCPTVGVFSLFPVLVDMMCFSAIHLSLSASVAISRREVMRSPSVPSGQSWYCKTKGTARGQRSVSPSISCFISYCPAGPELGSPPRWAIER